MSTTIINTRCDFTSQYNYTVSGRLLENISMAVAVICVESPEVVMTAE